MKNLLFYQEIVLGIFSYLLAKDIGSPGLRHPQHAGDHGAAATEHQRPTHPPHNEQIQFFCSWDSSTLIYMKDLSYKVCSYLAEVTASVVTQGSPVYGESWDSLPAWLTPLGAQDLLCYQDLPEPRHHSMKTCST